MLPNCPICELRSDFTSDDRNTVRFGRFKRKSDHQIVQRFRCLKCRKCFSAATHHPCRWQKKRHKNTRLLRLLASGVSQRRSAKLLHLTRRTVARKLIFLGQECKARLFFANLCHPKARHVQFDDMETFEHSKYKPLSITLAVEYSSRRILGFEVSQMPAKGAQAKRAMRRYGPRADERRRGRRGLFHELQSLVESDALIESDSNPHYPAEVKEFFPSCEYQTFLGVRGANTGQGELKKTKFDPLFSLNHTCAMFRANVCRLFRKTWCTTKHRKRLSDHLAIYAYYHNNFLIPA